VTEKDIECEVVTPLFSRGVSEPVNGAYPFELRPQSVKGVMRFWFRAIAPLVIDIYKLDELNKLNDDERKRWEGERYKGLKYLEELIFGSQNRKAPFGLEVETSRNVKTLKGYKLKKGRTPESENPKDYKFDVEPPFQSYSVYGLHNDDNMVTYQYIDSGEKFTLKFYIRDEQVGNVLMNILWMVSIFSGFGAKTRKGYGEFRIVNQGNVIGNRDAFNDAQVQVKKSLDEFVKTHNDTNRYPKFVIQPTQFNGLPEFPTFASYTIFTLPNLSDDKWSKVMEQLYSIKIDMGTRKVMSRGWYIVLKYSLRTNNGKDCVKNLKDALLNNVRTVVIPPSILGLPIQYQNLKDSKKPDISYFRITLFSLLRGLDGIDDENGRKGSPLFVSLHQTNDKWIPVLLLMNSQITNDRNELRLEKSVKEASQKAKPYKLHEDFTVVGYEDFDALSQLITKSGGKKYE